VRRTQQTERRQKDNELRECEQKFREETEDMKRELISSRAEIERLKSRLPEYRRRNLDEMDGDELEEAVVEGTGENLGDIPSSINTLILTLTPI